MSTLLVAINAKYSHTNLAIRYLKNSAEHVDVLNVNFAEYTINQSFDAVLYDIYSKKPDNLIFSCYIWNINYVLKLSSSLSKILPNTKIALGGPEVSFNPEDILAKHPYISYILCGEGEIYFKDFLLSLHENKIPSLPNVYSRDTHFLQGTTYVDLDTLPFPYFDLHTLSNRVIYYESSRGCPFSCSYCLSCRDNVLRFRNLELVFSDLKRFLNEKVLQVKFVDRTFNADKKRTLEIWKFLKEHDNGVTGFHFEIGADLLNDEQINFLKTVRPMLFQFEIGIQTTNETTLTEICRKTDLNKLYSNVNKVKSAGNIHQHLDLIAGLPYEDIRSFEKSFNDVFSLKPEMLQLGFLKLLNGTTLFDNRHMYDIQFSDIAPYEILSNNCLSYEDIACLKKVEEMVDIYYNSGRFSNILQFMLKSISPFSFFYKLSLFFKNYESEFRTVGKYELYDILYDFLPELSINDSETFKIICFYDIMMFEKPKKLPKCLETYVSITDRNMVLDFLSVSKNIEMYLPEFKGENPKYIIKKIHMEVFPFDVTEHNFTKENTIILCNYEQKNPEGNAKSYKF